MSGNPDAPGGGRAPADPRSGEVDRPRSGRVVEFALVAAGLGLVVYLLGFVADLALRSSLTVPLLLGGGLLAGSVVLATAGTRLLVPAAVATVTGALLLLQAVVAGADSPVAIGALVLALLEAAAAVAAALLQAGVVRVRPRRPKPTVPPYAAYPPQYPQFPGQQYPGQPYPGSYPGRPGEPYPADQYAGEHAYAQYARYGAQYGVPGYPPPPPHAAPVPDPPGVPVRAEHPTPEAPAVDTPAAGPDAGAASVTAVYASGAYPPAAPSREEPPPISTGSHAAPDPAENGHDGDDDRTRAIPRVTDER